MLREIFGWLNPIPDGPFLKKLCSIFSSRVLAFIWKCTNHLSGKMLKLKSYKNKNLGVKLNLDLLRPYFLDSWTRVWQICPYKPFYGQWHPKLFDLFFKTILLATKKFKEIMFRNWAISFERVAHPFSQSVISEPSVGGRGLGEGLSVNTSALFYRLVSSSKEPVLEELLLLKSRKCFTEQTLWFSYVIKLIPDFLLC